MVKTRAHEIEIGETVYAKWPGSVKFYEAIVDQIVDSNFRVTFKQGSMDALLEGRDVYKLAAFSRARSSSPARKTGRSRSGSPGRSKTSRSRSRSPSRKNRTPKRATSQSPSKQTPKRGRPRKDEQEEPGQPKPSPARRGRPRKSAVKTESPEAAEKPSEIPKRSSEQPPTPSRVTRSLTKTLVKEEREALLDTNKLEEMKENSRKPKRAEYEFGGPLGALFFIIALPLMVYAFYFQCHGTRSSCSFRDLSLKRIKQLPKWNVFFNEGNAILGAWILFQVALYFVPIGRIAQGNVLPNGSCLNYRINGFVALIAVIAGFFALKSKQVPVHYVYDKFPALVTAAIIWSFIIAILVYIKARREGTGLSTSGNTGNVIYDFFIGHQLNPRVGSFDIKFFFETRPGLLGLMILNFCMAAQEYKRFHDVSPAMMLVCAFQFLYVADCILFEASLLSTIDFFHEGFGFMLSFGNLVFVPFMFSTQSRFLADHRVNISWPAIVGIVLLKVVGYVIFRGSNLQKDFFRQQPNDPDFQDKETILTPSGKRLMVFGWWGMVRHPNYLGDILMAISWSLPCGFTHLIPWFYPIYLIILLVHRERRDEALCRKKYGKSYELYAQRVPYRIIPLIY